MSDAAVLDAPVPATASPPATAGPLPDLILARLLVAAKSPAPGALRTQVGALFPHPPSAEAFADAVAGLRAEGFLPDRGLSLTDAGRVRALAYLGASELPPRCDWRAVKAKYLVPKALGLAPGSPAIKTADKLAALLLKRKLDLPAGTPSTLAGVFQAVACRELGFAEYLHTKDLMPAVLARKLELGKASVKDVAAVAPRVLLDAPRGGMDGLRAVALAGLFDAPAPAPRPPAAEVEEFDPEAFAATVRAAARDCPTGRFGDDKVFISHVWRELEAEPRFAPLGPDGFKARLVEAHRAGKLTLGRADLVQVMDPADVRESETAYLNAVFHFIRTGQE